GPGTSIPVQSLYGTDLTTGQSLYAYSSGSGGESETWTTYSTVAAGDRVQWTIPNVTNASSTSVTPTISTSSDSSVASAPAITLTTPNQVASASVVPSTTTHDAKGVNYTVDFTASSTGALAGNGATLTVALPSGTTVP